MGQAKLKGKTVFILGAGASHGTSFESYRKIKPPLLNGFFETFAKYNYFQRPVKNLDNFFDFLDKSFSWTKETLEKGEPDIEKIIDSIDEKIKNMEHDDIKDIKSYWKCREYKNFIVELIADALHRSTWGGTRLDLPNCSYHQAIVKSLEPEDVIINLNYDLIMDMALINNNWDWLTGYNLPFKFFYQNHIRKWENIKTNPKHQIHYFKLHGSLNWFVSTEAVIETDTITKRNESKNAKDVLHLVCPICWYENHKLRTYQFGGQYGTGNWRYFLQRLIVGPGRKREYNILEPLWDIVNAELKDVREVFIVGCSLRDNDERLLDLLQNSINWSAVENFVIIDPDEKIKNNIEDKLGCRTTEYLKDIKEIPNYLSSQREILTA